MLDSIHDIQYLYQDILKGFYLGVLLLEHQRDNCNDLAGPLYVASTLAAWHLSHYHPVASLNENVCGRSSTNC